MVLGHEILIRVIPPTMLASPWHIGFFSPLKNFTKKFADLWVCFFDAKSYLFGAFKLKGLYI